MKKLPIIFFVLLALNGQAFVFYEDTKIWNQESITLYFLDGSYEQQSEVKKFAQLWQKYIGIQFKYTSTKPSALSFKKYYKITFKGNSNESTRGAINGTIHLGNLSDNVIFRKTTILHEFGHMLGLGHEHQRADRPGALNNYQLIASCIKNQQQSKKWCSDNLSDKNSSEVFIESEYDPYSIMHYSLNNITGDNKKLLDALPDSNANTLSYTDKYYIAMLYNQNISDRTLKIMHQRDLRDQKTFENKAKKQRELKISKLKTSSCKPLKYNEESQDGKFCTTGFMIIGRDGLSFPESEFKNCYESFKTIQEKMQLQPLCHLTRSQLSKKRNQWNNQFSSYGRCKRLEKQKKNNQEFFCADGFSFVSETNDRIGEKTECYGSQESVFLAMKKNRVCNMDSSAFRVYQSQFKNKVKAQMITKHCQVVDKKYPNINCPDDFIYTIIDQKQTSKPINNKCFASKYQAITAMQKIPFCLP